MIATALPLVVQYLYLAENGDTLPPHPSVRTSSPLRYLECAVTQAATLRLQHAPCDIVLITNLDRGRLDRKQRRLLDAAIDLDVQLVPARFHNGGAATTLAGASRFVRDAITCATEGQPPDRSLWVPNLDCVWFRPDRVFASAPPAGQIGCIVIPYPPDWPVAGPGVAYATPRAIGELAASIGRSEVVVPPWLGADLIAATVGTVRGLVASCALLDEQLDETGIVLDDEQQVLTLANALGRIRVHDLSGVARRIPTGSRHGAGRPDAPAALGLWHLPSEKGLSLRRAARALAHNRTGGLRRDLADPHRAIRRFNLAEQSLGRRARDDGWLAARTISAATCRTARRR